MSSEWAVCPAQAKPVVFGHVVAWHPDAIKPLQLAEALALKTEYGRFLLTAPDWTWFQTYNCRPISGGSSHSEHGHTIATDIRPYTEGGNNPMRDDGVFISDMDRFGDEDGVRFVMSFVEAGFRWGGNWMSPLSHSLSTIEADVRRLFALEDGSKVSNGRIDPMHFELEYSPAQVRARNYDAEIRAAREEDQEPVSADWSMEEVLF